MPPRRGKQVDLGVWGPPPPFPASSIRGSIPAVGDGGAASAPGPSSAFLQRFANRTAVIGKDGAQAQLGVAAVSASAGDAEPAAPPKQRALAPLPASRQTCNGTPGTAPSLSASPAPTTTAAVKDDAKRPVRIRIMAPTERARLHSRMLQQEQRPTSSPSAALHRDSRPSPPSTSAVCAEGKVAVKCVLAPSAAAAAAVASRAAREDSKVERGSYPLLPLRRDASLRPCPSTASSVGTPMRSPPTQSPSKASAVSLIAPTVSTSSERAELLSVPRSNHSIEPLGNRGRPAPTAAAAAVASLGHPQHSEPMKAPSPQAARLPSDRCQHSPSSPTATAAASSNKSATYKPYSLSSYKTLMADVAARKLGGLGPSDTDEQRAAREKRERAKAYARHAMKVARAALAGMGSCADEGEADPDTINISPVSSSRRAARARGSSSALSSSSDASTAATTTTTTSTSTSRSASAESPEHRRRPPRGAAWAALPPQATPPQHTTLEPSSSATSPRQLSASGVNGGAGTPSSSRAESTNAKSPKAVLPPLSAPPRTSSAVAAFAVAAAPRRQIMQARRRRERALTYAREVSQKRQRPTPPEFEGDNTTCAASGETKSRTRPVAKSSEMDEDDMRLGGAAFISSPGAFRGVDVPDPDRAQRLQRLLDLEALHATKREAVEVIRRHLRA